MAKRPELHAPPLTSAHLGHEHQGRAVAGAVQSREDTDDEAEDGLVVPAVLGDQGPAHRSTVLRTRPGRRGGPAAWEGRPLARDAAQAHLASRVTPS